MGKKTVADLVQEAAEAVKGLPEHLQEVAFSKAFEALSESQGSGTAVRGGRRRSSTRGTPSNAAAKPDGVAEDDRAATLDHLDRTSHPDIGHDASGLDNALRLLLAARDDLRLDSLSAAEIAGALTEKFRAPITRQAVGRALNGAGRYVDRRKEGSAVHFRIMGPGEDYLRNRKADDGQPASPAKRRTKAKRAQSTKRKAAPTKKRKPKNGSGKTSGAKARTSGSASPASDFKALLDAGFLESPRRIGELVTEIRDRTGRSYKSSELSPILLRQLRTGTLSRKKNGDGQYEYSEA